MVTLSNEILNMGLLIWASLQDDDPMKQAALVGFWASLGYIIAIFMGKYTFKLSLKMLVFITIMTSIPVLFLTPFSLLWGILLLARSMFGQVTYARVITLLPQLFGEKNLTENNKKIQLAISTAGLVTMIISPVLAKFNSIIWITGISLLFFVGALFFCYRLAEEKKIQEKVITFNIFGDIFKSASSASLMFYLTWIIFGTFFIIEVPLLKIAIGASPLIITLFMATGMLTNLITTKLIGPKMIDQNGALLFAVSCIGLVLFSFAYINSHMFITLYLSAFVLGIWNALMNITLYTKVQYLKDNYVRENRYIYYRLICEVGIFTGVMLIYLIHSYKKNIYSSLTILCAVVLVSLVLIALSCRLNPFKNEFKNV
jgi:MFS family permease